MALRSYLFQGNGRLEQCLVSHAAHVKPGDVGAHVRDIQIALQFIDGLMISEAEKQAQRYGPTTAAAVLAYKRKRKIINTSYQKSEDNIVGKMTMAALDKDMLDRQTTPRPYQRAPCEHCGRLHIPVRDSRLAADSLTIDLARVLQQHPMAARRQS